MFDFDELEQILEEQDARRSRQITVHERSLTSAQASQSRSVDQLLCQGSPIVAQVVALFGVDALVMPLIARVFGENDVDEKDRILRSRLGMLTPDWFADELLSSRTEFDNRLRNIADEELQLEVEALQEWHMKASGRLKLLERRAAFSFLGMNGNMAMVPGAEGQTAIRQAFKRKALELHPDKGGDEESFKLLQEFKESLIGNSLDLDSIDPDESDDSVLIPSSNIKRNDDEENVNSVGKNEEFNRPVQETQRQRFHQDVLDIWSRMRKLSREIQCSNETGGQSIDATQHLFRFVEHFANAEVSQLQDDPGKADRIFSRFLEQGSELLCAAAIMDPVTTVSTVAMKLNYPLVSSTQSDKLRRKCALLLEAIDSLPTICNELLADIEMKTCKSNSKDDDCTTSADSAATPEPSSNSRDSEHLDQAAETEEEQGSDAFAEKQQSDATVSHMASPSTVLDQSDPFDDATTDDTNASEGGKAPFSNHARTAAKVELSSTNGESETLAGSAEHGEDSFNQKQHLDAGASHVTSSPASFDESDLCAAVMREKATVAEGGQGPEHEAQVSENIDRQKAMHKASTGSQDRNISAEDSENKEERSTSSSPLEVVNTETVMEIANESVLNTWNVDQLRDAFKEAQEYIAKQRVGRPAFEYKGDSVAAGLAKHCGDCIALTGLPAPADLLLVYAELLFRAGAASDAMKNFMQITGGGAAAGVSRETLRYAHIGVAAAVQAAQEVGLKGALDDAASSAAAEHMGAALAQHQKSFHTFRDAKVIVDSGPKVGKAQFAVVLLHSHGGTGNDLALTGEKICRSLRKPCRLILPQGLYGMRKATWRDGRMDRRDPFRWDSVVRSLAQLSSILDQLEADGIMPEHTLLGGFSLGSFIAVLAALTRKSRLGGLLILGGAVSGRVSSFVRTMNGPAVLFHQVPVFIGHGAGDKAASVDVARAAVHELKGLGLHHVNFQVYPGIGHVISDQMVHDIAVAGRRWLNIRS